MKTGRTNASAGGGSIEHDNTLNRNNDLNFLHITETEKTNFVNASDFVEDFISNATDILYADLLALIDNNELIPSSSYRITNYTTTTVQADTQSAGHNFDIIVTALSTNELSENAKCVRKAGDTYFTNAKLEAWEIKYCIDNDANRFAWADTENGKGVIYYMKDEWNNECPYDFKNIQFKRYPIISMSNGSTDLVFDVDNQKMKYALKDSGGTIYPTGAFIDENNASYYFTFNAILQDSGTYDIYDASVIQNGIKNNEGGDFVVQNNKINEAHTSFDNPYDYSGQLLKLNNIVINNVIDSLVYTERSNGCYSNTFGDNCQSNTFGDNCIFYTLGNYCSSNTFGNNCALNTFGDYCGDNTFGNDCYFNTFGGVCQSNTFGGECFSNTFGNNCRSNTFGNQCYYNTFGEECGDNTFGNSCSSNTFGNQCYSNTFGNFCGGNTFGEVCGSNNFYHGTVDTTTKDYIRYIVLEDGCRYNNFYSEVETSSSSYLQRIRIKGLNYDTPTDTIITLPTANTEYYWVIASDSYGVIKQYCPEDNTSGGGGGITDAPSDNKTYGRKDGDWTQIDTSGGGGGVSIIPITWSDLKALRDAGTLVPSSNYRITDYTTTAVEFNISSVGYDFDVIVTALSANELSENAKCLRKDGDTYFENAKLEEWEIKYCIDNDTSRFSWADTSTGKGVIYYMKDEWNNECPYDFKNIKFKKSGVWLYTFGGAIDNSLTGGCHHNTMMDYMSSSVLTLNSNTFGNDCSFNTFGVNSYYNEFGNDCSFNTFGYDCRSNTFRDNFSSNTFGNSFSANIFGSSCSSNVFGNGFYYNIFGYNCSYNTFGNDCKYNTFGNNCRSNTFGNDCQYNNFYHGVSGATKKDYIRYIVLEDGVRYNNFYSEVITSSSSYLQRIRIKGLENDTQTDTIITLDAANTKYEWVVAKNSSEEIKQYCPEDLAP